MSMIEFGISIKLPGLEQFKPAFTTPFENIISNEQWNYLDTYERLLFRHQELVHLEFDVQDILTKHFGPIGVDNFWNVSELYFELTHHLDALFQIFVNYTLPVSNTIEACKQMNYVTFIVFCTDLGIDEYLAAYYFLISSRYNKEISEELSGPTFEDKCKYAYNMMKVR